MEAGEDLLPGDYELVSWKVRVGGEAKQPFGPSPVGRLSYSVGGQMWAALMAPKRELLDAASLQAASVEARALAAFGYLTYCGSYRVVSPNEALHEVHHEVHMSLLPDWIGTTQKRRVRWMDGDLILETLPRTTSGGLAVENQLRWRRLKKGDDQ